MATIPENITKENLNQAIRKIDQEGIPSDAKSRYYDVLHKSKRYPPKLVVSWANEFANGEVLERTSFSGGKDTACFKLLEKEGFTIVSKENGKKTMDFKAKIYKFSDSSRKNSELLQSKDGKFFFWDDKDFKNYEIGDHVFFINNHDKFAIYATVAEKEISSTFDSATTQNTFNYNYNRYYAENPMNKQWANFFAFNIIDKITIPDDWKWTKLIGSSSAYLLWDTDLSNIEDRIDKVDDLVKIFNEGQANEQLKEIKQLLNGNTATTAFDISEALSDPWLQEIMQSEAFVFSKGAKLVEELEAFVAEEIFYKGLKQQFIDETKGKKKGFVDFLNDLNPSSKEYEFTLLSGKLIAHIDLNGANKKEWNGYEDKRTLARSFVRQSNWFESFLDLKIQKNNYDLLGNHSVVNALDYLKFPQRGLTMLSENHRSLASEKVLGKAKYNQDSFVEDFIKYFEPYSIEVRNKDNLTAALCKIIYFPGIKELWVEKEKKGLPIQGLVVADDTGWQDNFVSGLQSNKYDSAVLWWHKKPSGTDKTIEALKEKIKKDGFFNFYYTAQSRIRYRARIIDLATEEDYEGKNWDLIHNVFELKKTFQEYVDGKSKSAKIIFLTDHFKQVNPPLPVSNITYLKSSINHRNLNPFASVSENVKSETTMKNKEILQHIHKYILGKGFYFEYDDIVNFYLSLKTKPFVILAGISGTGKTQLVRKFAEAIGGKDTCHLVPVKPDWTDNSDLIGYLDIQQNFHPKKALDIILKAKEKPNEPHFLILDEMNLARVEYYFSDFLSIIETREHQEEKIVTDPILKVEELSKEEDKEKYGNIGIPENLYVIGTVNMDETTHPFSRKVLDRANSIEMNKIELDWADHKESIPFKNDIYNDFLKTKFLNAKDLEEKDRKKLKAEISLLKEINTILQQSDLHFAYRVRDEVAFYLLNNKAEQLIEDDVAMDYQIMQKVLPRIQGSSPRIERILKDLLKLFNKGIKIDDKDTFEDVSKALNNIEERIYPRSTEKLLFMLKRYDDDGFTSFWQ